MRARIMERVFRVCSIVPLSMLLLASCATAERYGDSLAIARIAPYGESTGVTDAVRSECRLETMIPATIKKRAEKHFESVVLVDQVTPATPGRVLTTKIVAVYAPGGGIYSGPKSMTIEGVLRDNGRVIGTFTAKEVNMSLPSHGTIYAGMGTCKLLSDASVKLAKNVVKWLKEPSMNAKMP